MSNKGDIGHGVAIIGRAGGDGGNFGSSLSVPEPAQREPAGDIDQADTGGERILTRLRRRVTTGVFSSVWVRAAGETVEFPNGNTRRCTRGGELGMITRL